MGAFVAGAVVATDLEGCTEDVLQAVDAHYAEPVGAAATGPVVVDPAGVLAAAIQPLAGDRSAALQALRKKF